MASAQGMVIGAGSLAFIGSFKKESGFPSQGYTIIVATIILVFIASFVNDGPLGKPARALAGLMLLASAIRYVPGLASTYATKDKKNG